MSDIAIVAGIFTKYFVLLILVSVGFAVIWSIAEKIRNEPWTLAKVVLAVLTPFALAICIPYFLLHQVLDLPFLLNVAAGFVIYTYSHNFVDKHVDLRFKDEKD